MDEETVSGVRGCQGLQGVSELIKIVIKGNPIAKKRPRFVRRGKFVGTYNSQETEEGRWLWEAMRQLPKEPMVGPVKMVCEFVFLRPKSHFGTGRNAGKLKPSAARYHIQTPDKDNCEKFAMDCLNKHAYNDDCQVVYSTTSKRWAEPGEPGRTEIVLEVLGQNA